MSFPTARLGDLVEILSGFAFDAANFSDEGEIALIRIRDVVRGQSSTFYRGDYESKYLIQRGDILIGMDGEFNRARWESAPALLNQRVCKIVSTSPKLSDEYLFHFLPSALKAIEDTTSFVTVKHLSAKQIKEISIPLLPIEEQRRIAAILDQTETLRTQRRTALALLDSLTQSLFLDMFGDPVTNDREWADTLTLGEVADITSGVTKGRKLDGKTTREVPYLAVANVQDKALRLEGLKLIEATEDEIARYRLQKDDLLLTEGGDPDKLGRGTLWKEELPECIHQNHIFRVRVTHTSLHPLFLNWLVGSTRGKKYFLRSAKQTTGIASINMTQLRSFPLLIPPLPLQQTFATRIQSIESLKATHRRALVALDALLASLQQRAFRGELASTSTDKIAVAQHSAQNFEGLLQLEASIGQEALIYLANRIPGGDLYKTHKALYFADRHHLEHHGRLIYNETYCALPHGPVPQAAYDATRVLNGERLLSDFDDDALRCALRRQGNTLTALRDADFSKLSPEALESLEWAIRYCRDMTFTQTKTASHDSAYDRTPENEPIPLKYIIETLSPEARQRHWNL